MNEVKENSLEFLKKMPKELDEIIFNEAVRQSDSENPLYWVEITYYKQKLFYNIKGIVDFIKEHNIKTFEEYVEKDKKYIKDKRYETE